MKKTDRKIENAIIKVLTDVCESAKDKQDGFEWLTHFVNYTNFPNSLLVVCIYDTNDNLAKADRQAMRTFIKQQLKTIDVDIKDIKQQINFDTEENCNIENNGNWDARFG